MAAPASTRPAPTSPRGIPTRREGGRAPLVSIVVPTLDERLALPALLDHLAALPGRFEVIVADGGSGDGTPELARSHPLSPTVLAADGGRARQMNAAAAPAKGEALLFLHADTRLPQSAYASLAAALDDPMTLGGNFALQFDGRDRFSTILGAWYALQRRAGIYYGDSAIFVRREAFEALGGYRTLPIMEDYDLVRRLERLARRLEPRARTACLPGPAVTSGRRWRRLGIRRTVTSWVVIRWLFLAGVSPERLSRLYRHAR